MLVSYGQLNILSYLLGNYNAHIGNAFSRCSVECDDVGIITRALLNQRSCMLGNWMAAVWWDP